MQAVHEELANPKLARQPVQVMFVALVVLDPMQVLHPEGQLAQVICWALEYWPIGHCEQVLLTSPKSTGQPLQVGVLWVAFMEQAVQLLGQTVQVLFIENWPVGQPTQLPLLSPNPAAQAEQVAATEELVEAALQAVQLVGQLVQLLTDPPYENCPAGQTTQVLFMTK